MENAGTNRTAITAAPVKNAQTPAPKAPRTQNTDTTKATQARRDSKKQYDLTLIEAYANAGLADTQIILILNISNRTWQKLKQREDVKSALEKGRANAVRHVEQSLYLRCMGIRTTENGKEKYIPPSDLAIMYYLNNRAPDAWKHTAHMSNQIVQQINVPTFKELNTAQLKVLQEQIRSVRIGKLVDLKQIESLKDGAKVEPL